MSKRPIQPVVLCGGTGTRLWPLSRALYPKQLLPLIGDTTLLQQTLLRLEVLRDHPDAVLNNPMLVANEEHRFLIAEQLRQIGQRPSCIILEPEGRNTAPALTLAAIHIQSSSCANGEETTEDPPLLLVLPSDHIVQDKQAFLCSVQQATALAELGYIVSFGVIPNRAETGYGYLELGRNLDGTSACAVKSFVEKPGLNAARGFVNSGRYLWNSGMFMVRADVWMHLIQRHSSAIAEISELSYRLAKTDADFIRIDRASFNPCPADSIDYSVMEKLASGDTSPAAVVPLDAGWSDVGAWQSFWEISDKDSDGNVIRGDVFSKQVSNSLLHAKDRLLVALGVNDMIIIETSDAVLVAHKSQTQEIHGVAQWLKENGREEATNHPKVYRPWGNYECVDQGERYKVKRITVDPGASLSLQMHHHRAEHWIVVKGTARVIRGGEALLVSENESTFIPLGTVHSLENPGTIPLEMIEVQSGAYLGEDDIVRIQDRYGR